MTARRWAIPVAFALGAALVLGAMAYVTARALELERREARSRGEARAGEAARLALWRMDSALSATLAREAARPLWHFRAVLDPWPAGGAFGAGGGAAGGAGADAGSPGAPARLSPLVGVPVIAEDGAGATIDAGPAALYFVLAPGGAWSSPQSPRAEAERRVVLGEGFDEAELARAAARLEALRALLGPGAGALLAGVDDAGGAPALVRAPGPSPPTPERTALREAGTLALDAPMQARSAGREATQNAAQAPGGAPDVVVGGGYALEAGASESAREFDQRRQVADLARSAGNAPPVSTRRASRDGGAGDAAAGETTRERAAANLDEASPASAAPSAPLGESAMSKGAGGYAGAEGATREEDSGADALEALALASAGAEATPLRALWVVGDGGAPGAAAQLLLVRAISTESAASAGDAGRGAAGGSGPVPASVFAGAWLDWDALRDRLLEQVRDLVPGAELRPAPAGTPLEPAPGREAGMLASIPAALVLPEGFAGAAGGGSQTGAGLLGTPTRTALLVGWVAVLAAVGASALVIRALLELSERRGRFVSAVTHELRTPLTTFCLYSQMLADGMVKDEHARREYLGTLRQESARLARIVEGVLEYARLSSPRARRGGAPLVGAALAGLLPALRARAAEAGMALVDDVAPGLDDVRLRDEAGAEALDRALSNLVENACRYGRPVAGGAGGALGGAADGETGSAPGGEVRVEAAASGGRLRVVVADAGPGIAPADRARLFEPFQRGSTGETSATPGLGLGLALSRGMARRAGGDLRLLPAGVASGGAAFELTLPLDLGAGPGSAARSG